MNTAARMLLLVLSLLVGGVAGAAERRTGVVTMSTGGELKADLWFTDGKLRVYEGEGASGGRYINVTQNELVSITFSPKDQSMERPWRFKNAGSDEKEFLPGEYPLINLKSETRLKTGKTLTGHVMTTPLFVRVRALDGMDYEDRKFLLKYQFKGEVGQQLKDVEYVASIVFSDSADAVVAENGTISGTLKNLGKLEAVTALGCERMQSYHGKVDAEKNTFRIVDLPKDTYDVAVMTDRGFFVGLSDATLPFKGTPRKLEEGDGATIAKEVIKYRDFFDVQEVLMVKGHREGAKALVHQQRVAPVNDQQAMGTKQQHRLDVWYFHMRTSEWHINDNGRVQLFRYQDEAHGFRRGVQPVDELAGIRVDPAVKKGVEVNYDRAAVTKDKDAPAVPAEGKP